jgi:hypothetical protein
MNIVRLHCLFVFLMVFSDTSNNISVISVEETGVTVENQTFFSVYRPIPVTHFHIQNQYYNLTRGRCSHNRMIYGFTTTYAINVYHQIPKTLHRKLIIEQQESLLKRGVNSGASEG